MVKNWSYKTPGIPDEYFITDENVPGPTKEEVRVLTISKARLKEGNIVIDVGCGTGGLTVEAALQVGPQGKVYALDEDEIAVKLTQSNVEKFGVQNTVVVKRGKAPEGLADFPDADAVLIGGTMNLREILRAVQTKLKPNGRIVVNSILLETAITAIDELKLLEFKNLDITHISVSRGKQIKSGTMMLARNPITIVSASIGVNQW
ncbi:MAG: precorrin-6Y C5,15-methyltransferase (decarboxylating) subunit CbiT [Candidatus Bathyarchaeota archaeon]|uniref:precorrin-6Y C5,15-methyltransferase (decarboxylating) subunit CbiT n=1 Tax=Candidatus Bathycorpusculum sp. TaxID=2994959 RepID=UPI00282BC341|nr:precorrin-6Y C5,15-methyltransferase (decarboxylating) subunit CbiT [Candidatus Termiticorpusculum sp.]MCL2257019.1 precorrin-6Y C5,15-methyltransferase (decarboxylating) subunit CbiT [Candidatus Termiticorpusculum sp.]MCL2292856.1 precorrin-6Y C5,15-methyltransferase (decarboxylating) subunit CbiT [Candidatus Termiticorpusculum sp.]